MNEDLSNVLGRMGNDVISLIGTSRNLGSDYEKLIAMLSKTPEGRELAKRFSEQGGFRDRVILEHRDKNGKLIARRDSGWQHRCLTNTGFAEVAGLILTDVGGTAFDYIGIGTGTTGASATDTALETEVKRKAGTGTRVTTTVTNDTAQLVVTFAAADTLSGTTAVTESGVLNAATGGVLLCRQTFSALNINWDAGDTLQVTWKVQCKVG